MSPIFLTHNQYDLKEVLGKTFDQFSDIFLLPRKIGFQHRAISQTSQRPQLGQICSHPPQPKSVVTLNFRRIALKTFMERKGFEIKFVSHAERLFFWMFSKTLSSPQS